jgi:hypothetical protein
MRKAKAFPEISVGIQQLMRRHLPGDNELHSLSGGAEIWHKWDLTPEILSYPKVWKQLKTLLGLQICTLMKYY